MANWRHRSGSTLAQVMSCSLTAPSHYLNQCWLISSVQYIDLRAISQEISQPSSTKISLKITHLKFHPNLPGINELNQCRAGTHRVEFMNYVSQGWSQHTVYDITHQVLDSVQQFIEVNEWTLSFHVGVSGEETAERKLQYSIVLTVNFLHIPHNRCSIACL